MGEGVGLNDVSEQIEDEDQLLGTDDKKPNEEHDANIPSKNEKGIEMEEDFGGDTFSVSEDSENDENDDEDDPQLDSAMGEIGDENNNTVSEKIGDPHDDDENQNSNEKYESGPSVKDASSKEDEIRAKEDSALDEGSGRDLEANESNEPQKDSNGDGADEENHSGEEDDMKLDKDDAFADPAGIDPEDLSEKPSQEEGVDGLETDDPMDDDDESGNLDGSDLKDGEEREDELLEEDGPDGGSGGEQTANADEICVENDDGTEFKLPKRDSVQPTPDENNNNNNDANSGGQSVLADTVDLGEFGPSDNKNQNSGEKREDLAQTSGQPNASALEVRVADSRSGTTLSDEQSRASLPNSESLNNQKAQPNPFRSVGDALDGWKERVKVSVDLKDQMDDSNDMAEENADEYGYTADFKEGTAQALGPATAEQINGDFAQNDADRDNGNNTETRDPIVETEIEKNDSETGPIRNSAPNRVNDDVIQKQMVSDLDKQSGEAMEIDGDDNLEDMSNLSENTVILKRSYMSEILHKYSEFSMDEDDGLGKARGFEMSVDKREDAVAIWRRYEKRTTRLSQELAEQLRLVMEPTLANKLQGDYKTGKRINMKKVIPYVASHYRKDKIWLRRTKPSKRDYQVIIAVDDSRSMSEGRCGDFAVEALVTVCRAMSQLEVGNLAVASFGQQGNIRLLHDFDKPFTPESGIEMVSSLTFKQENTIADEPMVDLLKYLNNMMDAAVMQARLPSGYNPLQQLVLIIADGRFNEKEKLKRYVRDILSKRRMVAFLLLDSPNESIMDFMEATVQGKDIKFCKYLDSFPFPYYVVLKNIEALPRTLADLLRQWFELMQHSRE